MYKVTTGFEKMFGENAENTYAFPRIDQMQQLKRMCEEDGVLVIMQRKKLLSL